MTGNILSLLSTSMFLREEWKIHATCSFWDGISNFSNLAEVTHLNIGYGFDALLNEYFLIQER